MGIDSIPLSKTAAPLTPVRRQNKMQGPLHKPVLGSLHF